MMLEYVCNFIAGIILVALLGFCLKVAFVYSGYPLGYMLDDPVFWYGVLIGGGIVVIMRRVGI